MILNRFLFLCYNSCITDMSANSYPPEIVVFLDPGQNFNPRRSATISDEAVMSAVVPGL